MATHEPDRSTRRRWFRMHGSQQQPGAGTVQPDVASEPEASVSTEESPPQAAVLEVPLETTPEPEAATFDEEPAAIDAEPAGSVQPAGSDEPGPSANGESAEAPPAEPGTAEPASAGPVAGGTAEPAAAEPATATDELEPSMMLPRVISIANQKGGVGKTTTAVNLGAALAEIGYRVLVVDLDPQGNATTGLGISHRNVEGSIYDVIMNDTPLDDCVEPTSVKNLFVCPATIDLAGAEIELVPAFSRELKLKRALQSAREDYDFTLIDCPPSLGLLTVNGLAASDDVVVPIQCEYYAIEGLGQLLRNVALVKSNLNPELDVRGIVLTMYDARTRLAVQVEREVREHFGPKVYRTVVPRTVRISEAPSFGEPIIVFDATSRGAVAYRELAKEVSRGTTRRAG
jgi:chromosome partitioning protein